MNTSEIKNILTRVPPDPLMGHDRVRVTVSFALEELGIQREPTGIKNIDSLGLKIIPDHMMEMILTRAKKEGQNIVTAEYISAQIEGVTPLADMEKGVALFERTVARLAFSAIQQRIKGGETINTSKPISRFVMVRHGDKNQEGKLSETGIQEARAAGKLILSMDEHVPVTGVFGVQQPNVQLLMMALQLGKNADTEEEKTQEQLAQETWESLPKPWREPYRTGEVTLFDVMLSPEFNRDSYASEPTESDKRKYIKKMLQLRIERNAHTETYDLSALGKYYSLVHSQEN